MVICPWVLRNQKHFGNPYVSAQASNMFANYHVPLVWESAQGIPFGEGQRLFAESLDTEHFRREQALGRPLDLVEGNRMRHALAPQEPAQYPAQYAYQWGIGIIKTLLGINITEIYASFHIYTDRLHFLSPSC